MAEHNDKDFQKLLLFLDNQLSDSEVVIIQARLEKEPELQKLLYEARMLAAGVRQAKREQLREHLKNLDKTEKDSDKPSGYLPNYPSRFWAGIGMAAIILFVGLLIWTGWNKETCGQDLLENNFGKPLPSAGFYRSQGNWDEEKNLISIYDQAVINNDVNQYQKAEEGFRQMLTREADRTDIRFFLAMSLLGQKKVNEAEKILQRLEINSSNSGNNLHNILYYLAVTELYHCDKEAAIQILKRLEKKFPKRKSPRTKQLLDKLQP
ncbi:MAG: tetratricopeptide repeat protein [Bacteroidetes bacterium]|nr:tetratricopeptide repeat protein [Bacteroidota bacterium]